MTSPMTLFTAERIFRSTTGNVSASKIIATRKSSRSCSRIAKTRSFVERREYQVVEFNPNGKRTILRHYKRGVAMEV